MSKFNLVRGALHYDGDKSPGTALYNNLVEARRMARVARKNNRNIKVRAVEVDLTNQMTEWANAISYAARNPEISPAQTQEMILELIQWSHRGY